MILRKTGPEICSSIRPDIGFSLPHIRSLGIQELERYISMRLRTSDNRSALPTRQKENVA